MSQGVDGLAGCRQWEHVGTRILGTGEQLYAQRRWDHDVQCDLFCPRDVACVGRWAWWNIGRVPGPALWRSACREVWLELLMFGLAAVVYFVFTGDQISSKTSKKDDVQDESPGRGGLVGVASGRVFACAW